MKKRIFLIEDDEDEAKILIEYLKEINYEIEWANDGKEGIKRILKDYDKISLIILDFLLPNYTGDIVARVLKFNEKTKNIPVLLLTSRITYDTFEKTKFLNIDRLLYKPYNFEELKNAIQELIEKYGK